VTNRARPGLDSLGMPIGAWTLFPQLGVEGMYTDNVFALDHNEQDDQAGIFLPSLRLNSATDSYSVELGARGEIARYADHSSEDYEDGRFWANGETQVGSVGTLGADVSFSNLHELRTSPDDIPGSDLTKYTRTAISLAYTYNPGSLFARVGGHVEI